MTDTNSATAKALKALINSLVSEAVPDAEVAATLAHIPGCGDIIPAVLNARKALRDI